MKNTRKRGAYVYDNLPHDLKTLRIWCVWKYIQNPKKDKPDKVPFNPLTKQKARTNHPDEFVSFDDAVTNAEDYDGIGAIVPDGKVFIDIDGCVANGIINKFAAEIIRKLDMPFEISPSGKGLRGYCKAHNFIFDKKKYYINHREIGMEIYVGGVTNRFLTLTGNVINEAVYGERGEQLQTLLDEYMLRPTPLLDMSEIKPGCSYLTDEQVIEKAMAAKNGEQFCRVWHGDTGNFPSDSEADVFLAGRLAFWCGRDYEQMERLFSKSKLGQREKWVDRADYRHRTIIRAITNCRETYSLDYKKINAVDVFDIEGEHMSSLIKPATAVTSRDVPWQIEGFLISGALTSIQGLPDSGKSFLTCALAVAKANGGEFPRADGTMMTLNPGRVLFANFDDALEFGIKPRFEKLGLTNEGAKRIFFLDPETASGITFDDKRLAAVFEECKPDLAIFDTLQHFIGGKVDLHRANETNTAMAQIKILAEKYNTAVVIVQHISKNAAGGSGGASVLWGLGSTAINGLFRSVWTVGKVKGSDENLRAAVSSKNNLLPFIPPALQYSLSQSEGFQWRGVSREVTARDLIRGDSDTASRGRPAEQRDEAEVFMEESLKFGKVKASEIYRLAEKERITTRTLKRAKARLGVKSFKEGVEWFWELPDENKNANIF